MSDGGGEQEGVPGQFIGFTPISRFSTSTVNMWSLYFSQCPDVFHSSASKICGVLISL